MHVPFQLFSLACDDDCASDPSTTSTPKSDRRCNNVIPRGSLILRNYSTVFRGQDVLIEMLLAELVGGVAIGNSNVNVYYLIFN
jgi:hypothetical protein